MTTLATFNVFFLLFHRLADPTKKILKPFRPNVIPPIGYFEVASEGNWAKLWRIALWECLGTKFAPVSSIYNLVMAKRGEMIASQNSPIVQLGPITTQSKPSTQNDQAREQQESGCSNTFVAELQ